MPTAQRASLRWESIQHFVNNLEFQFCVCFAISINHVSHNIYTSQCIYLICIAAHRALKKKQQKNKTKRKSSIYASPFYFMEKHINSYQITNIDDVLCLRYSLIRLQLLCGGNGWVYIWFVTMSSAINHKFG